MKFCKENKKFEKSLLSSLTKRFYYIKIENMKFLIVGAGAIGSVIGGFLKKGGENVSLVGNKEHMEAIEKKGLIIEGIWGEHYISRFKTYEKNNIPKDEFDFIIVSVKSYNTQQTIEEISQKVKRGVLVSAQNGVENLEIMRNYWDKIIGMRVIFGAEIQEPGRVKVTVKADDIVVGWYKLENKKLKIQNKKEKSEWKTQNEKSKIQNKENEKVRPTMQNEKIDETDEVIVLNNILNRVGLSCRTTDNILAFLWAKMLYNCPLNALSAILEVCYGRLGELDETRMIMKRVVEEIFEVLKREKIKVFWENADEYMNYFYEKLLPPTYNHISSMLQDLQLGRRTEIESMNGYIVKRGKDFSLSCVCNDVFYKMIKFKEENLNNLLKV